MMFRWGVETSPECDCSVPNQTMNHILNEYAERFFADGFPKLQSGFPTAIASLSDLDINV